MTKTDPTPLMEPADIMRAVGLLTRLPVPVDGPSAQSRGAGASWAYPLAGLIVALIAGVVGQVALWLGLPSIVAAILVLTAMCVVTGALHEDGLADVADGFWGGWVRERRLEIMKDSRIGAYGVIALVLSLLLRMALLTALIDAGYLWQAVIVVGVLSRAAMVVLMHGLRNARGGGLSRSVGRPSAPTTGLACGIAFVITLLSFPASVLLIMLVAALSCLTCALIARAKIGGQTGDVLGATGQVVEMTVLMTLVVAVA